MQQREEVRQHVISVATKLFHSQGIRSVTMDNIAHELTMSKRTLYQLFADKEELLLACLVYRDKKERERLTLISQRAKNVLEFLLPLFVAKMREMDQMCSSFFADVMKYPRVMEYFEQHKRDNEDDTVAFLNRGKEQGLFRDEINFRVVTRQLSSGMEMFQRNGLANEYSQRELFENTVLVTIRGCATPKGVSMIDEFFKEYTLK